MKRIFAVIMMVLFLVAGVGTAFAVDPSTCVPATKYYGKLKVITLSWVNGSGGDFTDFTTPMIDGMVYMVLTDPDGSTVPTDNYDVTLKNSNGIDIMGGKLTDRDETNTEVERPYILSETSFTPFPVDGALTLAIADAGNSKVGVIKIYVYISGGN